MSHSVHVIQLSKLLNISYISQSETLALVSYL